VHLDITRAYVGFITFVLNAMIVRLFSVVLAITKLDCAVVRRCESQETVEIFLIKFYLLRRFLFNSPMTQRFRPFLMPLQVPYYFFFFVQDFAATLNVVAVIMFSLIFTLT
jgi:hypothetical protein